MINEGEADIKMKEREGLDETRVLVFFI